MTLEKFGDKHPRVDPTAFVHTAAVVIGDVIIGPESSVWPHVTLRGDDGPIVIGSQTSIQDNTVIHCTEGFSWTRGRSRDRWPLGDPPRLHDPR